MDIVVIENQFVMNLLSIRLLGKKGQLTLRSVAQMQYRALQSKFHKRDSRLIFCIRAFLPPTLRALVFLRKKKITLQSWVKIYDYDNNLETQDWFIV